jgi:hypothetical protein
MRLLPVLLATALLSLPLAASADILQYSYSGSNPFSGERDSFSFTLLNSTPTAVYTVADDFSPTSFSGTFFDGTSLSGPVTAGFTVGDLIVSGSNGIFDLHSPSPLFSGPFSSPTLLAGQFSISIGNEYTSSSTLETSGTLTVTDLGPSPSAATPEPSSLALLATGLAGAAGILRRRLS